jgi:hypothetical protein
VAGDEGRRVPARDGDRDGAVGPVGAAETREALRENRKNETKNIVQFRNKTYKNYGQNEFICLLLDDF